MQLVRARMQNFKCVEDSGEFTVDRVTCLIGKNESGKTALLEALYKLNPVEPERASFDEEEFPRRHLFPLRLREAE
jgi:predicted ATP-dependent endonuclease of OLD family